MTNDNVSEKKILIQLIETEGGDTKLDFPDEEVRKDPFRVLELLMRHTMLAFLDVATRNSLMVIGDFMAKESLIRQNVNTKGIIH